MFELIKSEIDWYVANSVKEYRLKNRLSQLKLATQLGVSHSFIQQVEDKSSRSKYNLIHLNSLANILKCSPKDFLPEKPILNNS